jgi:hypothetical protein
MRFFRFSAVAGVAFLAASAAQAAGGPYAVDDSEIGAPGDCKVEIFAARSDRRDWSATVSPACTFAALPFAELGLNLTHARAGGDDDTLFGPKAKVSLVPIDRFGVGIGVSASATASGNESRFQSATVLVPFTIQPFEPLRVSANLGFVWDRGQADKSQGLAGLGFEWVAIERVTLIGEVFAREEGRAAQEIGLRFGAIPERLDLDLVFGRNLDGDRTDWLTLGAILKF